MSHPFPFTAVLAQQEFKKALILNAINPLIGGVLVSGPRGCAKSTLARALGQLLPTQKAQLLPRKEVPAQEAQLLPAQEAQLLPRKEVPAQDVSAQDAHSTFVTLPLGASEEMLLGSLDLQEVLNQQQVKFQAGLLAKAHGGVLYVDEVNLLNDSLVDLLLDVSASGVNVIERDGISHSHDARFILLGTMNPDEGELRAQLQDRFGLMVQLDNQFSIDERMEIVALREEYENNPAQFCDRFESQQQALLQQVQGARELLPKVRCSMSMRKLIAQQCVAAQVEGLRADLVWYRAALSHAAFCGHEEVQLSDIEAVKELVLAHRNNAPQDSANNHDDGQSGDGENGGSENGGSEDSSQQSTLDNNGSSQQNNSNPYSRPQDSYQDSNQDNYQDSHKGSGQHGPDKQSNNDSSHHGQWGSMAPEFQSLNESRDQSFQLLSARHTKNLTSRVLKRIENFAQGKGQGATGQYDSSLPSRQPNWFKTLIHNGVVKRDQVKQEGANKFAFTQDSTLVFKKQKTASTKLHFILLDTSASTLLNQSFAQAKQIILSLAQQAYVKRDKLAIMGFGNSQVKNLLASVRAPKHIREFLEAIPAAGGTPFHEALVVGQEYLQNLKQKMPALQVCSYILSDGRISQHNLPEKSCLSEQCLFIDTESSQVKRGRGESIAKNMGAQYLLANT